MIRNVKAGMKHCFWQRDGCQVNKKNYPLPPQTSFPYVLSLFGGIWFWDKQLLSMLKFPYQWLCQLVDTHNCSEQSYHVASKETLDKSNKNSLMRVITTVWGIGIHSKVSSVNRYFWGFNCKGFKKWDIVVIKDCAGVYSKIHAFQPVSMTST